MKGAAREHPFSSVDCAYTFSLSVLSFVYIVCTFLVLFARHRFVYDEACWQIGTVDVEQV